MKVIDADTAHSIIADAASKAISETRYIEKMEVGQVIRQGDLYIHRVESVQNRTPRGFKHKLGTNLKPTTEHQLVDGNTVGSRHCISETVKFKAFVASNSRHVLEGPVVEAETRLVVSHPEHAWIDAPPGCYQITYQQDYADEMRRVRD